MNLFELANSYDCVYKWFTYLKETKDVGVVSFVIMPNHVHVILHLPDPSLNLNKIIGNGKRFMAYALIEKLESKKRDDLLDELYGNVTWRQRKKGQKHRVFEESFDAKPVYTDYFLKQKMDYIHHNPVRGSGNWLMITPIILIAVPDFMRRAKSFSSNLSITMTCESFLRTTRGPEAETPLGPAFCHST